jgi:hypothetical protein
MSDTIDTVDSPTLPAGFTAATKVNTNVEHHGHRQRDNRRKPRQIVAHAIRDNDGEAICGAVPGRNSEWKMMPDAAATCPQCVAKIGYLLQRRASKAR